MESCKDLCQNFLHLIRQNHRDGSVQEVFKAVLQRDKKEGEKVFVRIANAESLEMKLTQREIALLEEATTAAGEEVNLEEVNVKEVKMTMEEVKDEDWKEAVKVVKIFGWEMKDLALGSGGGERSMMREEATSLKIKEGYSSKKDTFEQMKKVFKAFSSVQVDRLSLQFPIDVDTLLATLAEIGPIERVDIQEVKTVGLQKEYSQ